MKLNKFLLSAIAAASLTACSDSTDVVNNNKGQWNADGTGYVSLSISMPDNVASKGSRANDNFEKGDDNEYAVKNATLVIFSGDDDNEATMTIEAAYNLPINFTIVGDNGDQIISKAQLTTQINQITKANAKALVILNKPAEIDLAEENDLTYNGTSCKGKTFEEFQKFTSKLNVKLANGFTMTNAPLTTGHSNSGTAPTTGATSTLATITMENIKSTAAQAAANPAANIYVERSVAKVTVGSSDGTVKTNNNIKYNVVGFVLDNTNKNSFIVRHADKTSTWFNLKSVSTLVNGNDKYRFVGVSSVDGTAVEGTSLYRTYWAEDPNYDNGDVTNLSTKTSYNGDDFSAPGDEHPQYCMENTFDVANQTHKNTTRAILKVQMWKGDDTNKGNTYYMYNNDSKTFAEKSELISNTNNIINTIVPNLNKTISDLTFTTSTNGKVEIESVTFNGETDATTSGDAFDAIKNHFGKITVYENGYTYYNVLIKHFGDDLTPWNENEPNNEWNGTRPTAGGLEEIYPTTNRDANYLGRYGVVRNNWYNINVKDVNSPGNSVITDPSNDNVTDDELNSYISVNINILSWAKRSQDVDLQ